MDTVESAVYDDYSVSGVFPVFLNLDIENFPVCTFSSGQLIFKSFFNDATTSSMTSIIGSAALIKKGYMYLNICL